MATLQTTVSPGSRLEASNHILERAKSVSTKPIKSRFDAFKKSATAFAAAESTVQKAEQSVRAASTKVAELDTIQDEALHRLASAMAGDGASRINPFKALGFAAPTIIADLGYEKEVQAVTKLVSAALRAKSAGKATKAAASALLKTTNAVGVALPAWTKTKVAHGTAIAKRDAIGLDFDRALAKLKRAARVAEDDGAEGLFDALFYVEPTRTKKKKTTAPAAAAPAPAPTNGATTASAPATGPTDSSTS